MPAKSNRNDNVGKSEGPKLTTQRSEPAPKTGPVVPAKEVVTEPAVITPAPAPKPATIAAPERPEYSIRNARHDGLVEVVAVPANAQVRVRDVLTKNGEKYPAERDTCGCKHFFVPEDYARSLLAPSGGGLRFVLVSGAKKIVGVRRKGLYMEEFTAVCHRRQEFKGEINWLSL